MIIEKVANHMAQDVMRAEKALLRTAMANGQWAMPRDGHKKNNTYHNTKYVILLAGH